MPILKSISDAFTAFEQSFQSLMPYLYGMTGALCLTSSLFFAKQISYLPTSQLINNRSAILLALTYPSMKLQKQDFGAKTPKINRFLILRGFLELGAMGFYYIAIKYLPISEATIIMQTCPTIVGLLSALFLGEKYELSMLFTSICCMTGIIFVAKPTFLFQDSGSEAADISMKTIGVLWATGAAGFLAFTQILIRKISSQTNSGTLVIYFALISTLTSSVLLVNQEVQSLSLKEGIFMVFVSAFSFGGQSFRNRALKYGKAGKVSMMSYTQIVFAFTLDIFVTRIDVDPYSMIGAIWIFSCLFVFIYQNFKQAKVENERKAGNEISVSK